MVIHILHEIAKEIWKGQFSFMGEENGLWNQMDMAANPSPSLSKLLNLSTPTFLALQDCERLNEIAM